MQANLSKEKVFKNDVSLTNDFLSLNYPSGRSIKITNKDIITRAGIICLRLRETLNGKYKRIGKKGVDKLIFWRHVVDEYIQLHVVEILDDYFTNTSYSSFRESSTSQLLSLLD